MTAPKAGLPNDASASSVAQSVDRLFQQSGSTPHAERDLENRISAAAAEFTERLHVAPPQGSDWEKHFLETRMPEGLLVPDAYVDSLIEEIVKPSTQMTSPLCMANMTSTLPYFVRPLGRLLMVMNQNMVKEQASRALTRYERQALAILHRLVWNGPESFYREHVQNDSSSLGIMVSGGTLANITAMWCARNALFRPRGNFGGAEQDGSGAAYEAYGCRGAVIIGSALMHYSFEKAAALLGLGAKNVIKIPVDASNRVRIDLMAEQLKRCIDEKMRPIALVGIAGTTDSGSIDPLDRIAGLAQEAGVHFHVDAAWGGPLLMSDNLRPRLKGIERADSVTLDGHKQFCLPIGIATTLFRDPQLPQVIARTAQYIMQEGTLDLGKRALEGSRPGMALFLHAGLNVIGRRGYAYLVERNVQRSRYMADRIRANPVFELLFDPEFSIVLYRYIPAQYREAVRRGELSGQENAEINRFNQKLQLAQSEAGVSLVSYTSLLSARYDPPREVIALRAVILNPNLANEDIDRLLEDQQRVALELERH